ncbi:hypothetical protein PHAVU_007G153300 [Phaseolus vulgaris]|uniref:Uncharacterized protein n=1 Tax=Phaseolus vulgaris TaxID=3885 RepID=V7BHP3_PHAVU|nr:hypothetical protein PHAVU_007G153300g [Phaseolus vulgaris]ESW16398.1 hypothetical protein PHAVU_007G153300g [Phaseolus vulgaris]
MFNKFQSSQFLGNGCQLTAFIKANRLLLKIQSRHEYRYTDHRKTPSQTKPHSSAESITQNPEIPLYRLLNSSKLTMRSKLSSRKTPTTSVNSKTAAGLRFNKKFQNQK